MCGFLLVFTGFSCFHDLSAPLSNDIPHRAGSGDSLADSLFFPDTVVCTLSVIDRNDSLLTVSAGSWPGRAVFTDNRLGGRDLVLSLPFGMTGDFQGNLVVFDEQGDSLSIPYTVRRRFLDDFDGILEDTVLWSPYDTSALGGCMTRTFLSERDGALLLEFSADSASSSPSLSAGLRSRYSLKGDFCCGIDFRLMDGMKEGFEAGFFVSTSNSPLRYAGEAAGMHLVGAGTYLQLKSKGGRGRILIEQRSYFSGRLVMRRRDTTIAFYYKELGRNYFDTLTPSPFEFSTRDTVFLHVRMDVSDRRKSRYSIWNDFVLSEGTMGFEEL